MDKEVNASEVEPLTHSTGLRVTLSVVEVLTKNCLYGILELEGMAMKINNRKGVALLIALSIVIILVILASAMLMLVRGHYGTTSNQIEHAKDYYLAEAGVQYAIARLSSGIWSAPWTYSISVEHTNDVQIQLKVNANNGGVIIYSTSNY